MTDQEFVSFLFDKLVSHVDTEMIDLSDDDTAGIDAILFQQLELPLSNNNWNHESSILLAELWCT